MTRAALLALSLLAPLAGCAFDWSRFDPADASLTDGGPTDASLIDGGMTDASPTDGGTTDASDDGMDLPDLPVIACPGLPAVTACRRATPPVIDGNASDWSASDSVALPSSCDWAAASTMGGPTSDADCSATYRLAWDDAALYAVVVVRDDVIVTDSSVPWQDDSVELYLDGGDEHTHDYDGNDYQLMLGANGAASGATTFPASVARATHVDADGHGYTVEYGVDVATLGGSALTASRTIGVAVAVNDDDDGTDRDGYIATSSMPTGFFFPDMFGTVTLSATPCE